MLTGGVDKGEGLAREGELKSTVTLGGMPRDVKDSCETLGPEVAVGAEVTAGAGGSMELTHEREAVRSALRTGVVWEVGQVTGVAWEGVLVSEDVCRTESKNMTVWEVGLRVGLAPRSSWEGRGFEVEEGRGQGCSLSSLAEAGGSAGDTVRSDGRYPGNTESRAS